MDGWMVNTTNQAGQLDLSDPSWTSSWVAKLLIFLYNDFVTGEDDKALFSDPSNTLMI